MNLIQPIAMAILIIVIFSLGKKFINFIRVIYSHKKALGKVNARPAHWFWGHLQGKSPDENLILDRIEDIKRFPKSTVRWVGPILGTLVLYFPTSLQTILNTEEPKDFAYSFLKPWIGDGLLISGGVKWKRNRRLLTGAFHFDMLKNYLKVFNETVITMLGKWEDKASVSICEDVSLMTLDSMLQCATSFKSNCQEVGKSHPYINAVYELSIMISKRLFNPIFAISFIFFNFTSYGKRFKKAAKIAHEHSELLIQERKQKIQKHCSKEDIDVTSYQNQSKSSLDFLDILLLARDEKGKGLTDREIRDEVDTFLFEGHDTTASGISWALYNLARHPEIQERCRQEINQVLGDRNVIKWEDLNKFEYLTMCIKESLRLHSPVFSISRELTKPLHFEKGFGSDQMNHGTICNVDSSSQTFPTKLRVETQIQNLHRNPFLWSNPRKFDPERFTQEEIAKRSPFSYLPFSAGPRNCIGQNFAMMELKVSLASCLKKFRIKVDESYPRPEMLPLIVLRAKNGIHLKLEKL